MANRPLAYTISERKATVGTLAGKTVIQANSTGRKRADHHTFCEEVAKNTWRTATSARSAPHSRASSLKKGKEEFNATVHFTKPVVKLIPSQRYFTLTGVTYERMEASAKKP